MKLNRLIKISVLGVLVVVFTFTFPYQAFSVKYEVKKKSNVVDPQETVKKDQRFNIPAEATKDTVTPGTFVTVLPTGCTTVHKKKGLYYSCANGIYLKPAIYEGKKGYFVVEKP